MTQSFAKVALTPKWLGALLAALALAAIFAGLGQWQLDRALNRVGSNNSVHPAVEITEIAKPTEPFKTELTSRRVTLEVESSTWLGLVTGRRQNEQTGNWNLALATLKDKSQVVIAYDFQTKATKTEAPKGNLTGHYLPSEDPTPKASNLASVSVEQLINLDNQTPAPVYRGFVAISKGAGQPILIKEETPRTEINALNAFYAIEWTLFAGFAVFLWWRLVQDERLGLKKTN